ncbi:DNAj [Anaeramoeba ignava]|uniref:DNAj n=1 Tax=Anaeramoeba ignava TaxID=1746090 RepID=A0A9Q0R9F2_ANAIG|nr:DNAj [Anaeramoeba ignava]
MNDNQQNFQVGFFDKPIFELIKNNQTENQNENRNENQNENQNQNFSFPKNNIFIKIGLNLNQFFSNYKKQNFWNQNVKRQNPIISKIQLQNNIEIKPTNKSQILIQSLIKKSPLLFEPKFNVLFGGSISKNYEFNTQIGFSEEKTPKIKLITKQQLPNSITNTISSTLNANRNDPKKPPLMINAHAYKSFSKIPYVNLKDPLLHLRLESNYLLPLLKLQHKNGAVEFDFLKGKFMFSHEQTDSKTRFFFKTSFTHPFLNPSLYFDHLIPRFEFGFYQNFHNASKNHKFEFSNTNFIQKYVGLQFGIHHQITNNTTLSGFFSIGLKGISLNLGFDSNKFHVNIPILLTDKLDLVSFLSYVVIPSTIFIFVKKFVINLVWKKLIRKNNEETKDEDSTENKNQQISNLYSDLLQQSVNIRREKEEKKDGLIIQEARYGDLKSDKYIDVTSQLQFQVEDSKLKIYGDYPKSKLFLFEDPSPDSSKSLWIRYLYQKKIHEATFKDLEEVEIPNENQQI